MTAEPRTEQPDAPVPGAGQLIIGDPGAEDRVACVCCGWSGDEFAPFGAVTVRRNAQCPACGALERHRLVYSFLRSSTRIFSGGVRVLHIAPEPALARTFRATAGLDYVTTDLNDPNVSIRMDIQDMLFKSDVFDFILCSHVLEHVPDDRAAMREIHRVLKPDGFAIIQVPVYRDLPETIEDPQLTDEAERIRRFGQRDHVRKYGADYPQRLGEIFDVEVVRYPPTFSKEERDRYGFAQADIHICRPLA